MKTIPVQAALKDMNRVELAKAIREGGILVYPTDTLYGIGCNAFKKESVEKIAKAKERGEEKAFSVIAPSKGWITENTRITADNAKFVDSLLPGPYTVVLKSKIDIPLVTADGKIGIRIPKNEFCDFIRSQGVPFVTTSVNLSTTGPARSMKEVPEKIAQITDYAIDAGQLSDISSRIFDISGKELVILRW
jgi:tRNA threonylcarbamoyl adenosine modification protein (Sua5/YciO/YrdC/YwlC family)